MTVIHHGTPMTPRAALLDVLADRAGCVSFYRPDDLEVVLAIARAVMFRQWPLQRLAGRLARRAGVGREQPGRAALLRLAGADAVPSVPLGGHPRYPRRAVTTQRRRNARLAVRTEGRASLAHGWADRAAAAPLRAARQGMPWLDRAEGRQPRLSRPHGRGGPRARQPMASAAHAQRDRSSAPLSIQQRRQHFARAERVAL